MCRIPARECAQTMDVRASTAIPSSTPFPFPPSKIATWSCDALEWRTFIYRYIYIYIYYIEPLYTLLICPLELLNFGPSTKFP